MSAYEYFDVTTGDGIATITMNRAPLNVMHNPMMEEFNSLLESVLPGENCAAVVIRATGKAFSAGVDVADHTDEKVGDMIRLFHGIFRKLAATDALTIAAVQGAALGGGCELACFCDIVLASDRAKFGQPEVQIGVFPPVAASVLVQQVGIKKAIELAVVGMTIRADEALRIGLVNQVFPAAEFDASVDAYVGQIRKLSRPVVRMAKRSVVEEVRSQVLKQLDRTEELYLNDLMALKDAHEGVASFMEKRAPVWNHA